jgi:hypothetical protein
MKTLISLFLFILLLSSCNKKSVNPLAEEETPSLDALEKTIRESQDKRAAFSYDQYETLLNLLSDQKFIVLSMNKFRDSINPDKVIIGLRHDVDCHPFKALEIAQMEKEHGFGATYYFLATAKYSGEFSSQGFTRYSCMESIYRELSAMDFEIGIHNDLLSILVLYQLDPFEFNKNELDFYNSLGIKIYGTAAHGSSQLRGLVDNFEVFSDFATQSSFTYQGKEYPLGTFSLKEAGYRYEAYFVGFNNYYSDSGGHWSLSDGFDQLLSTLRNSKAGTKIQILMHPVWWGKK